MQWTEAADLWSGVGGGERRSLGRRWRRWAAAHPRPDPPLTSLNLPSPPPNPLSRPPTIRANSRVSRLPRSSNRKGSFQGRSVPDARVSRDDELVSSSYHPRIELVAALMDAHAKAGDFDEIVRIVEELAFRGLESEPEIYSLAVSCCGDAGQLHMMEEIVRIMVSRGLPVDSLIGNMFVKYYSKFGSLSEMEGAYHQVKASRVLVEEEAIRAMASAYMREKKFYELGEFLRDAGLGRRNMGNVLWNLLLLSYAANFKMKSLQREFLNMVEAGFAPDLTTFNVRALAFSRMCMLWDLHLSIKHMKRDQVVPDVVTYGCFVDLYVERRLGRNLSFAFDGLDMERSPVIGTDPLVFEALGKGDFHSSAEMLLASSRRRDWTYSKLVRLHLKKQYRRNQIFWNY